ncbi:MAG: ribose 5-phosphate isomerase B [Desulfobacter sp.]|nr:MAG: ribose 5-phosphate isomerase B [Desulfobacter sp.]
MSIAIGCDHVAIDLKEAIKAHLSEKGISYKDFGTFSAERMDYPVVAADVCKSIQRGSCNQGILICGTGVGMSIAANKFEGVRSVVCSEPFSAKASKEHNNTNVLALGARVVGAELAKMIVDSWLTAEYEGGRHQVRIDQIYEYEKIGKV